jgi:hypothetical protein
LFLQVGVEILSLSIFVSFGGRNSSLVYSLSFGGGRKFPLSIFVSLDGVKNPLFVYFCFPW